MVIELEKLELMKISDSIEIMKSLADPSRLRVLNVLMEKPHYVGEIASRLNLAISTVSFHLKKLENADLVTKTKEQYYIIYKINDRIFNFTLKELTNFENIEKYVQDERIEKLKNKVIKTFIQNNKLTKLPVQRKKKMIIIEEFVKKFENGRKYGEDEVNDIITSLYDDYCVIRRIMVEENIMKRENQIYWLNEEIQG
ncbi:MAG: ArsR family transcriptional regulator [Ignavibacteriae bacterium HGW-Ignavibacteriae-2]|jgi:hypothetical protein|nr:MAG: ArsR family transcriptional regulator [Ignavibacteriae bacterium HGW-Ignavibacteriae-2]